MRDVLTRIKRHKQCSVLLLGHSYTANNCTPLFTHSDKIVFTKSPSNVDSFVKFSKTHSNLESEEVNKVWSRFMAAPDFSYLSYDMSRSRKFTVVDTSETPLGLTSQPAKVREKVQRYLGDNSKAMNLFEFIFDVIDCDIVGNDLAINVCVSGKEHTCSLLDFLKNATDKHSRRPCKKEELVFTALTQKISFPKMLLENKFYLRYIDKN